MIGTIVYADQVANSAATTTGAGGAAAIIAQFLPFVVVIVLLYFMMIRPQKKREKQTKDMLSEMKVGDKIVTIGGIVGKITKIKDQYVYIETGSIGNVNEKSYLKMERSAIKEVEKKEEA